MQQLVAASAVKVVAALEGKGLGGGGHVYLQAELGAVHDGLGGAAEAERLQGERGNVLEGAVHLADAFGAAALFGGDDQAAAAGVGDAAQQREVFGAPEVAVHFQCWFSHGSRPLSRILLSYHNPS